MFIALHTFCGKSILPILLALHLSLQVALAMTHKLEIAGPQIQPKLLKKKTLIRSYQPSCSFHSASGKLARMCLLSASWNIKTCGVG